MRVTGMGLQEPRRSYQPFITRELGGGVLAGREERDTSFTTSTRRPASLFSNKAPDELPTNTNFVLHRRG